MIPALGHDWDEGVVQLSENGREFVVFCTCRRDASHTRTLPLNVLKSGRDYYYYIVPAPFLRNSDKDARFAVKHRSDDAQTFSKFLGIAVDNQIVSPEHYLAAPGSVVIDIKTSYMNQLTPGNHTIRAVFTDGYADASFTVTAEKEKPAADSPKTGEGSHAALWLIMLASMAVMLACLRRKKRMA